MPVAATCMVVLTGMAYTLLWAPLVRHHPYWITPADLWGAYRSAHFIGWGYVGGVYSAGTSLVTFPGILFLLAPVAMLSGAFGLKEAFPYSIPHPTAWIVLGPIEMLLSSVALFATDAIARHLGVANSRRAVLCLVEGAVLWNVCVTWGHPEDALAIGLAAYSLLFAIEGRWTGSGWLFGAAMATQPLVILILPILIAMGGRRRLAGTVIRSFLPTAVLLVGPLVNQFHSTIHAILDQPNYPRIDHATPWTVLAPRLGGRGLDLTIAAGPGRVVALLVACALGFWAIRWRDQPGMLIWAAALALSLRCFTESVMDPFYIWPTLALGLVAASASGKRLILAGTSAILVTVVSDWRLGELPWWLLVSGGLILLLALSRTGTMSRSYAKVPMNPVETTAVTPVGSLERPLAGAVR